ncbi:MAG: LuxR C-terminal-related transcriptional regulator [Thermomicrobiales bacterium]
MARLLTGSAAAKEALEIADEIGWPAGKAFALIMLSMAYAARGEFEQALDSARAGLEIAEWIDHREWTVMARYSLGRTLMELHQIESAERELELALALARQTGWQLGAMLASATLAFLCAALGDADRGAAVLGTLDEPSDLSRSMAAVQRRHARAQLHLATGNIEEALRLVEGLVEPARHADDAEFSPLLLKLHGDVLARVGRVDQAEAAYRAAAKIATLHGFLPLRLRINAALGNLYRAHDRTRDADTAHQSARSTIELLAEKLGDADIRETFRSQSEALIKPGPDSAFGEPLLGNEPLTPREHEVLSHLIEGKTDREIADELFISPRTVMRHVGNILKKLDVSSRTAAATLAVRHDLI